MSSQITIPVNRELAEAIEAYFRDFKREISIELEKVEHTENYSIVQLKAKGLLLDPVDVFWLGYFSRYNIEMNTDYLEIFRRKNKNQQ